MPVELTKQAGSSLLCEVSYVSIAYRYVYFNPAGTLLVLYILSYRYYYNFLCSL